MYGLRDTKKRLLNRCLAVFCAICLLLSTGAFSQENGLTPEKLVSLKRVNQVAIDPGGEKIAYVLSSPRGADELSGRNYSEIWVTDIASGDLRQYTSKPVSAVAVSWTPDGEHLLFRTKRKETNPHTQVYSQPWNGGIAKMLTSHDTTVTSYKLSPLSLIHI